MREEAEVRFFERTDVGFDGGVEGVDEDLGGLLRFGEVFGHVEGVAWTGLWWFGGLRSGGEKVRYWRDGEVGAGGKLREGECDW